MAIFSIDAAGHSIDRVLNIHIKIGMDVVLEALKRYKTRKKFDIGELLKIVAEDGGHSGNYYSISKGSRIYMDIFYKYDV